MVLILCVSGLQSIKHSHSTIMATMDDEYIIDGSDEDQTDITPADILQRLKQSWIDERMCPELLQHNGDVVDCMLDQIYQMENNLKRISKTNFKTSIHKMELDRIRYLAVSYLRCRLRKIETFHRHLLASAELRSRLSPQELQFASEFQESTEGHFREAALRQIPPAAGAASQSSVDDSSDGGGRMRATEATVAPNLQVHVFLRAQTDCAGVLISDETGGAGTEEVDLVKHSQYLLRYEPISKLLYKGDVSLI